MSEWESPDKMKQLFPSMTPKDRVLAESAPDMIAVIRACYQEMGSSGLQDQGKPEHNAFDAVCAFLRKFNKAIK